MKQIRLLKTIIIYYIFTVIIILYGIHIFLICKQCVIHFPSYIFSKHFLGGLYDAEGSYRMWWSKKSWKKFQEKTKCYEDQYNKYYMPVADTNV